MKRLIPCMWCAALLLLAATHEAYAYLDPGTGSMLLQGLVAAVAAVSVTIGLYWTRFKLFLNRVFGGKRTGGAGKASDGGGR